MFNDKNEILFLVFFGRMGPHLKYIIHMMKELFSFLSFSIYRGY